MTPPVTRGCGFAYILKSMKVRRNPKKMVITASSVSRLILRIALANKYCKRLYVRCPRKEVIRLEKCNIECLLQPGQVAGLRAWITAEVDYLGRHGSKDRIDDFRMQSRP